MWDAHTNEGRWWVISNPTNLYSQELIKSMDVALSLHVGLMSNEATIWSMALAETQQLRMLERLRSAGKQPVTLGDALVGFGFPAVVISELEPHGYAIDRVYEHGRLIGVRLLERKVPDPPASRRRQRWPDLRDSPVVKECRQALVRAGRHDHDVTSIIRVATVR